MLAAVGEQSDKPLVSTFLGAEGVPELLRVPDVAGQAAGRGSVPSYPARRGGGAGAGAGRRVRRVAAHPRRRGARHLRRRLGRRAAGASATRCAAPPRGRRPDRRPGRGAARRLRHRRSGPSGRSPPSEEAQAAGRELGWDVVLKATAGHLRQRPDLAHVWRNIDTPARDARTPGTSLNALITSTDDAGFVVQQNAPPGVPVSIGSIEDPLFGPVVSFGIAGPSTELLGDRSYRIPPLTEHDAAAMVREIKSVADAVRLPRLRGRRRRRGRAADPAGRAAQARPARRSARSTCRWCSSVPTGRRCCAPPPASTRWPSRAPTGSPAGCRRRQETPRPAEPCRRRVTDCRACAPAPPRTATAPASSAHAIDRTGYYPEVVADGVDLGGGRGAGGLVLRPPRADLRPRRGTPPPDRRGAHPEPAGAGPHRRARRRRPAARALHVDLDRGDRAVRGEVGRGDPDGHQPDGRARAGPPRRCSPSAGAASAGSTSSPPPATTPSATPTTATRARSPPTTSRSGSRPPPRAPTPSTRLLSFAESLSARTRDA